LLAVFAVEVFLAAISGQRLYIYVVLDRLVATYRVTIVDIQTSRQTDRPANIHTYIQTCIRLSVI